MLATIVANLTTNKIIKQDIMEGKLSLQGYNTSLCGNFYTDKIGSIWNRHPTEAVNSCCVKYIMNGGMNDIVFFFYSFPGP